jgi:PadR family transcriptional regulator AphA
VAFKQYLLGILSDQPMTGYSLYKFLFDPFGRPLSQIYRTLAKMTKEGLVEFERSEQAKLPDRKVYRITEAGHSELIQWLKHQTPAKRTTENEVLAKIWFGAKVDKKDIAEHFKSFKEYAEKNLSFFKNEARPLLDERAKKEGSSLELACRLLTIEYAIRQYEIAIKWARTALNKIEGIQINHDNTDTAKAEGWRETGEEVPALQGDNNRR